MTLLRAALTGTLKASISVAPLFNTNGAAAVLAMSTTAGTNHVSLSEIINTPQYILSHSMHSLLIGKTIRNGMKLSTEQSSALWRQISSIFDPIDVVVLVSLLVGFRPIMRVVFNAYNFLRGTKAKKDYRDSYLGYLQPALQYGIYLLPVLYFLDVVVAFFQILGITTGRIAKLPRLINTIGTGFVYGQVVIQTKDYLLQQRFKDSFRGFFQPKDRAGTQSRVVTGLPTAIGKLTAEIDEARERTIDELVNVFIWTAISLLCLEALSEDFGFRLRSLLAIGGVGSASVVLALKSTFENFAAGVMLKLQDKFRLNDTISVKKDELGVVADITYLNTVLRRSDGSVITIPNSVFNSVQVINWTRTPFRLFKSSTTIPATLVSELHTFVDSLRAKLGEIEGIDAQELLIAANSFKDGKIGLDITMQLKAGDDMHEAQLRTLAIKTIVEQTSAFSSNSSKQ